MRQSIIHIIEMILGAGILALGLFYLVFQNRSTDKLIDEVNKRVINEESLYLQSGTMNSNQISDDELIAMIIGYREYPIIIDSHLIAVDGIEYAEYLSYVRSGIYTKTYIFDADHNIIQVVYSYAGA